MAVAYKCDRCGKLYEVNLITHENVGKFFIGYKDHEGNIGNIDLCGNCNAGLELFLKKRTYIPAEIRKILMEDDRNG